ncbi:hypothetical protein EHQ27_14030, partial [Leptospira wolffii]
MPYADVIGLFGKFVYKGIEISHLDKREFLIEKAIAQVSYPIFNELHLSLMLKSLVQKEKFVQSIIPIVITTSPLYVVNQDVSVETLENAKDTKDIATEVGSLIYSCTPSDDLKTHNSKIFTNIRQLSGSFEEGKSVLQLFTNLWPEAVIFINYN